jgi:hypothetical protein
MAPKHVLVPHRAHRFIIDVQASPSLLAPGEHVDRKVPTTCGLAVVVKYPIELVLYRIHKFPDNRSHGFWTERATRSS